MSVKLCWFSLPAGQLGLNLCNWVLSLEVQTGKACPHSLSWAERCLELCDKTRMQSVKDGLRSAFVFSGNWDTVYLYISYSFEQPGKKDI